MDEIKLETKNLIDCLHKISKRLNIDDKNDQLKNLDLELANSVNLDYKALERLGKHKKK